MTDTPPEEPPAEDAAPVEDATPVEDAAPVVDETPVVEETTVEADPVRDALVAELKSVFGDAVVATHITGGDLWVRVANDKWADVVSYCKLTMGFRFFDFLAGMDWLNNPMLSGEKVWDREAAEAMITAETVTGYAGGDTRFQVMCRLHNVDTHVGITFKTDLADDAPTVPTISHVFAGADWHERETWEMYGFNFDGHPGLRHLYLPGAFEGFPLRKDFPLLAREIKPWPGLVDKEPMPGETADEEEEVAAE